MPVIKSPVGGGSGNPFLDKIVASGGKVSSGLSAADTALNTEKAQLQKGLGTAYSTIASSPEVIAQNKLNPFLKRAEDIAAGNNKKATGALAGVLNSPIGKAITGAGAILGTGQRAIVSTLEQGGNLLFAAEKEGGGSAFSLSDWANNITDSSYGVGKVMKTKGITTGNGFLDGVIAFAGDVALDPLTYILPSSAVWSGRSGRLMLATKAAEAGNIVKAPTLAGKLDDIARIGEWALDDAERAVLGVKKGLRFGHGVNAQVIPKTGGVAEAIGGNWAKARAFLGDTQTAQAVTSRVLPASYGQGLKDVGRGVLKADETTRALAHWTSNRIGDGAGRVFMTQMLDRYAPLMKEIAESPYRETVIHAVHNPAVAVDDVERELATKISTFYADMVATANQSASKFAAKHGITSPVGINVLDNYGANHSLSDEAGKWLADNADKAADTKHYMTVLKGGDLSADDLLHGAGPARMRKLVAGEEWLGQKLTTGTLDEINSISMDKLGFKWFKEDMPTVMNDYVYSLSKQVKRTAYMNRLADFGTDYMKPLVSKMIPDKALVKRWETAVSQLESVQRILRNSVDKSTKTVERLAGRQAANLEKGIQRGAERTVLSAAAQAESLTKLESARGVLAELEGMAATLNGSERSALQTTIDATKTQIDKMQAQVVAGNILVDQGKTELQKEFVRLFPNAKKIPEDIEVLRTRVQGAVGRSQKQVDSLVKNRGRLQKEINKLAQRGRDTGKEYELLVSELDDVEKQLVDFQWLDGAAFDAPYTENGLVYMPIQQAGEMKAATILDTSPQALLEQGADMSQVVAMRAPKDVVDITSPMHYEEFLDSYIEGLGLAIEDAGNIAGQGVGMGNSLATDFVSNAKAVIAANDMGVIDEAFAIASPELTNIIAVLLDYGHTASEVMTLNIANKVGTEIPEYAIIDMMNNIKDSLTAFENTHGIFNGWGDQSAIDALGEAISIFPPDIATGDMPIALLMPAQVFDDAADLGEQSLVMSSRSGWLKPDNLDSAPSVIADSPVYQSVTAGQGNERLTELMGQAAEIKPNVEFQQNFILPDLEAGLGEARLARDEMSRQIRNQRGQINRQTERNAGALGKIAEGDNIQVWEKTAKGGRRKVTYTREKAEARLADLDKSVTELERKLAKANSVANNTEFTTAGGEALSVRQGSNRVERLQTVFNKDSALAADAQTWDEYIKPMYEKDLATVQGQIRRSPAKGPAGETATTWAMRTEAIIKDTAEAARLGDKDMEAFNRVVVQLSADEADLAMLEAVNLPRAEMNLSAAQSGRLGGHMVDMAEKGWKAIEGLGVQIPDEMYNIIHPNMVKLKNPAEMSKFLNAYQQYHRFFKIYATLTPGFSIRNAMSSTFTNYTAGVTTESMIDGIKGATAYVKYGPDKWIERLGLSAAEKEQYRLAWEIASSTGAGQTANDIMEPILNGKASRILNNKATRASGKFNEGVEFSARFGMALNDVRAGLTFDEAATRISRFHFDYTDLSKIDKVAKNFVPFWIWTSRNVPLQIANTWTRPSVYAMYDHLRQNTPVNPNIMMPKWMAGQNPLGLGGNWVANPDLPNNQMQKQIELLSDPKRLLGNLNPLLKLPIEMYGSNQLQNDIPFGNKPVEAKGLDMLTALIGLPLGQTSRNAQGQTMISPKLQYAVGNILPPFSRTQRLLPQVGGGKDSYSERQLSSWLQTFGLPIREITAGEQKNEAISRQFQLQKLITELRNQGYVPKG